MSSTPGDCLAFAFARCLGVLGRFRVCSASFSPPRAIVAVPRRSKPLQGPAKRLEHIINPGRLPCFRMCAVSWRRGAFGLPFRFEHPTYAIRAVGQSRLSRLQHRQGHLLCLERALSGAMARDRPTWSLPPTLLHRPDITPYAIYIKSLYPDLRDRNNADPNVIAFRPKNGAPVPFLGHILAV
jgi:hypothetical protein